MKTLHVRTLTGMALTDILPVPAPVFTDILPVPAPSLIDILPVP